MTSQYELRKLKVLDILNSQSYITVSELGLVLDLSPASVRRLCSALEHDNIVIRTRGGLRNANDRYSEYYYKSKINEDISEKKAIAIKACSLVKNDSTIFLEAGSTVFYFANELAKKIQRRELNNVTAFTNSLLSMNALSSVISVNLIGGTFRTERQDFSGYLAGKFISQFRFDIGFFGTDALSLKDGLMVLDFDSARTIEALKNQVNKRVVLVSSNKFDTTSLMSYSNPDDDFIIVTDNKISKDMLDRYSEAYTIIVGN